MNASSDHILNPAVAIIGGGPAGLSAAEALASRIDGHVLVLERESDAGGIPRHSDHTGYGLRDLHRVMRGPKYARHLDIRAREAGAEVITNATVTGWNDGRGPNLTVTSPAGLFTVAPEAVILATGARERPRPARKIPGDRPHGVLTTGQLQNLVHLHRRAVGRRAVVVGSELVSWSAAMTLREAGCATTAMITERPHQEAYLAFWAAGRIALRVPVLVHTRVVRIIGRSQVEGIEIEHLPTGERETLACDTVVFTGDWIPDHELARLGGLTLDPGTKGPVVDQGLQTTRRGVFAAGNLVHPVDTADVAALDGRHVAAEVAAYLGGDQRSNGDAAVTSIIAGEPFAWASPNRLAVGATSAPRDRLLLWPTRFVRFPVVQVWQDGRVIAQRRLPWAAAPGRVFRLPWGMVAGAEPSGGPIRVELA